MSATHAARFALLLLAVQAAACNLGGTGTVHVGSPALGHDAQREERHALELGPGGRLNLASAHGSIEVHAKEGAAPALVARIEASGRTPEEAAAILERYELVVERGPEGPSFHLRGEPLTIQDGVLRMILAARVDYVATVPPGTALHADTGSGEIRTLGPLGSCTLETNFGRVTLEGARGDVQATSGSGDVEATDLAGGALVLTSEFGAVTVRNASGDSLRVRSGSGDLRAEAVRAATIELSTDFGTVTARGLEGDGRVRSGSGALDLEGVSGSLAAESDFGAVTIAGRLAGLEARSGSGDVRVRALPGSHNAHGWSLRSSFGAVELCVPEDFACALDARTAFGEASCAFPLTLEAGASTKANQIKGSVGAGGAAVTLRSDSGNVALKRL